MPLVKCTESCPWPHNVHMRLLTQYTWMTLQLRSRQLLVGSGPFVCTCTIDGYVFAGLGAIAGLGASRRKSVRCAASSDSGAKGFVLSSLSSDHVPVNKCWCSSSGGCSLLKKLLPISNSAQHCTMLALCLYVGSHASSAQAESAIPPVAQNAIKA